MTALDTSPMTAAAAQGAPALVRRLLERAWEFDCLQAIWLLERHCRGDVPVGGRGPVARENLRFRPDLSLGFPATDLRRVLAQRRPDQDAWCYVVEVTFLGLYGVATPLPLHYAVDILRSSGRDAGEPGATANPVRDLLDVLHHRIVSLFYQAWEKYRFTISYERGEYDRFSHYLLDLIGLQPSADQRFGAGPQRPDLRRNPREGILQIRSGRAAV